MNIFKLLFIIAIISNVSCGDKDEHEHGNGNTDFKYHINITAPNTDDKKVNDILEIEVTFESHSDETVHHVNVSIYEDGNMENVIYSGPDDAHVHATEGTYLLKQSFVLSNDNKVEAHTDWILEAKVWGHEAGVGEVIETVKFHVHPE